MRVNRWWHLPCLLALSLGRFDASSNQARAVTEAPPGDASKMLGRIVDSAHMFEDSFVRFMDTDLEAEAQNAKIPILIETIESLDGRTIQETIEQKEPPPGSDGIYVLLVKKDRKIQVRVAKPFAKLISEDDQQEIREAFIEGLRAKEPEVGLAHGVRAIARTLRKIKKEQLVGADAAAQPAGTPRRQAEGVVTDAEDQSDAPLIVRHQVKLALAGARRIIEGAEAKAREMGLKVNIAIVDDGGHLLAFARMDGARPASGYTALTKATTAATFRQETGPLPRGTNAPDPLLNLSLQNAAAVSGGKLTTLFGGVPVMVDDQVIGAVGVGGGSGEQDAMVAKAGIDVFLKDLKDDTDPTASEPKRILP